LRRDWGLKELRDSASGAFLRSTFSFCDPPLTWVFSAERISETIFANMLSRELVRTLRVPASALMAIAAAVHTPAAPPDSLSGDLKSAASAAQSQHSAASIAAL
jgi:hypothetical protein